MTGKELVPLPPTVASLPSPREFGRLLREWMESEILRVRAERGEVNTPEDTFELVRSLQRLRELLQEYAHTMTSVANIAAQEVQEELLNAVGEQDGVPLSGLTVPDLDGTEIKMSINAPRTHHIDQATVLDVLVADALDSLDVINATVEHAVAMALDPETAADSREQLETILAGALRVAIDRALELGTYSQQVTKVKAFAKRLAGAGQDKLAGVVTASIKTTTEYSGIKVARTETK